MWRDNETGQIVTTHSEVRILRPLMTLPSVLTEELIAQIGFETVRTTGPHHNPHTHQAE